MRDGRRGPLALALSTWAASLVLASPLLFEYAVKYSLSADAFIAACLASVTVFYLLLRRTPRSAPPSYPRRGQEIRIARWLGGIGVLGSALLLADARLSGDLQFSLGYLVDHLSTIRLDNFDALASSVNRGGLLVSLGSFAAPCAVLCVIAAVRLGREGGTALRLLAVANFVLMAAVSLMIYAGRATIVNLALLALVSLYITGRRVSPFRPRTLVVGVLALASVWYLSTSFFGSRERNVSAVAILADTQRAEQRPWVERLTEGNEALGLTMASVGYFASPVPTLTFYMQQPVPGPLHGRYSYPLPARVLGTFNGTWTRNEWYAARLEVFAPIESRNYAGNVWATWLRDLLVDFGYVGGVVFCALFGMFMAWARNSFELTGALHYHYLEAIACFTLGFGAFTSFLWSSFVAYPFFLALAIMLAMRVRLSPTQVPAVSSPQSGE